MKTKNSIQKLALKLHTSDPAKTRIFALNALGGREVYEEPGLSVIELNGGNILEIYGAGSNYPTYLFRKNNLVVSYLVADLKSSVEEAIQSGMTLLYQKLKLGTCYNFCHLSDVDGNIIELREEQ